jgi:DNA replication protein DnaC
MPEQLTYADLLKFTNGTWETMTDEEQDTAYVACARALERSCRESSWKNLCPPGYRNTIPEQLPNVAKFEEVQKWQYGPKGLLVVGPTRRGKTRSVWKLLERLHIEERRKIIVFTPMDLKLRVMSAWQDVETAEDLIYDVHSADVLFFDDLDTVKFTEAVEETIYDAFEFRPTYEKPVIATVNRTGRELATRMNANGRGAKIVERMREYCQVVNFT